MKGIWIVAFLVAACALGMRCQQPHQLGGILETESVRCEIHSSVTNSKGFEVKNCKLKSGKTLDNVVDEWYTIFIGNVSDGDDGSPDF